jgi:SAM-dependent methyltransferase
MMRRAEYLLMSLFICNVCGGKNSLAAQPFEREAPSCQICGSSVRVRGLLHALSRELLGISLALPDFPRVHSLSGLGLSDAPLYAERLREKLDYRNTFYDREPRFDLLNPPAGEVGKYDFILASEVFEHIPAPVERAFVSALTLLKPNGVLVFTTPYSLDARTVEHFPTINQFGLAQVGCRTVLVNRSPQGRLDATDGVVFHVGCAGPAPEFREFSEDGLRATVAAAGFREFRIYSEDYIPFGVVHAESWSLPIAARRGPFGLSQDAARDIVEHWRDAHYALKRLGETWWYRAGRKLRICD